ncbi:FeoA family protein [Methanospirillum hungatei]|jgi:ferrous iron transport protein A|uniref:FeoA family protein n=1 Tax=Methanospirillum hungatei TaxID=2203 RepID=UPI0026EB7C6C|nr:FeoA family protein [Methanospirillum hungatei]MCA1915257.1 ferrous iron transport protein A [Methanospirillum hungatei]
MVPLSLTKSGEKVVVRSICGTGHLAKTLGQLGIIIGIELTIIQKAKESVIVRIGESRYALGAGAASMVLVEPRK